MPAKLDLSQLKLCRAVIEIRYDNAYTLWDRAGLIWSKACSIWAGLKTIKAEPNTTTFILNERFELSVSIDKAHLIDAKPSSSLKEFMENAELFVNLVSDSLDIAQFTRLGFRLIYSKVFPDKITAANTLISSKMLIIPEGKHFNIEGKPLLPKYSLTWEGESTGVRVTLVAQEKKVDLDVPLGIEEFSPVHIKKHEVIYDIDYYTMKSVSKGQLNVTEWISQAYHLIKRDSQFFMGK